MPALVRRDDVQAGRQAEPDAADERVGEAHAGQVDPGVACRKARTSCCDAKNCADASASAGATRGRIARGALRAEARLLGGGSSDAHEPAADQARPCRTAPRAALGQRALAAGLHRAQVDAVGRRQVVQAFRDAPRVRRAGRQRTCASLRPATSARASRSAASKAVVQGGDDPRRKGGRRACPYPRVRKGQLSIPSGYGEQCRHGAPGTGKARLGEPTLTASDWAEAALQLIAEKGLRRADHQRPRGAAWGHKGQLLLAFHGRVRTAGCRAGAMGAACDSETIAGLDAVTDHGAGSN